MKDSRAGESLWSEWSGEGYLTEDSSALIFFTEGHVDVEHEVVRKALASAIQRDGSTDSLYEAFNLIDSGNFEHGYAGVHAEDKDFTKCDATGMTYYEDQLENVVPITWVEVSV